MLGKQFFDMKVDYAVKQIQSLLSKAARIKDNERFTRTVMTRRLVPT